MPFPSFWLGLAEDEEAGLGRTAKRVPAGLLTIQARYLIIQRLGHFSQEAGFYTCKEMFIRGVGGGGRSPDGRGREGKGGVERGGERERASADAFVCLQTERSLEKCGWHSIVVRFSSPAPLATMT